MNSRTVMFSTLGGMKTAFETGNNSPDGDETIPVAFGPASRCSKIYARHQNGQVWGEFRGQFVSLHDPPIVTATDGPGGVWMGGSHPNPLNYMNNGATDVYTKIGLGLPRFPDAAASAVGAANMLGAGAGSFINGGPTLNYPNPMPASAFKVPQTSSINDLRPIPSQGLIAQTLHHVSPDSSVAGPCQMVSTDYNTYGSYDTTPNKKTLPGTCGNASQGYYSYGNYGSSPNARSCGENCADYLNSNPYYTAPTSSLSCDRSWGTAPQASFGQYAKNTYFSGAGASNPINYRLVPSNTGSIW